MDERRRRFLQGVGSAAAIGTAGCLGRLRTLTGGPSTPPAERADAQFRGETTRRGVSPEQSVPSSVTVDWRREGLNTGDHTAAKASPVQAPNGDVVVSGDTGEVWAVRPEGEIRWRTDATDTTRGFHGTPAIANGTVYVGAYDGALYAFDLETGERYWRTQLGDAIGSSPGYHDGRVYIAVEYYEPSGAIFALDAVTGEVVWEDRRITNHPHSTCAIDREAGRLVVGSNDGYLYCWSYPDHEFLWRYEAGEDVKGPIATWDGSAFFGSWSDEVYRVALADGSEEWATDLGASVMAGPSVEPSTGTVYVGDQHESLYALDAAGGDEQWETDVGGPVVGCPTVTSDHVLVGSYEPKLCAVEKATGDDVWSVPAEGNVTSTPLMTDEAVYFAERTSEASLDGEGSTGALYRVVADE
jgi:outer membrane protein assembly factor BamB